MWGCDPEFTLDIVDIRLAEWFDSRYEPSRLRFSHHASVSVEPRRRLRRYRGSEGRLAVRSNLPRKGKSQGSLDRASTKLWRGRSERRSNRCGRDGRRYLQVP